MLRVCSTPLAAAATKPAFQAAVLALAAVLLYFGAPAFAAAWQIGAFRAGAARLRALEACGAGIPPGKVDLAAFGLLYDGCPINGAAAASANGSTWTVRFPAAVRANGYFFDAAADPAAAPCRWVVEADADGSGQRWDLVSASVWRTARGGGGQGLQFYPGLRAAPPTGPGSRLAVNHGDELLPAALFALVDLELAACMLCMVAAAFLDQEDSVRGIVLSFIAGAGLLTAAEAGVWLSAGNDRAAADAAMRIVALSSLGLALGLWEQRLVPALFAASAVYTVAIAGSNALYGAAGGDALERAVGPEYCAVAFALATVVLCMRWAVIARAERLVLADAARYDALWATISSGEEAEKSLAEIRGQVRNRHSTNFMDAIAAIELET